MQTIPQKIQYIPEIFSFGKGICIINLSCHNNFNNYSISCWGIHFPPKMNFPAVCFIMGLSLEFSYSFLGR